MNKVIDPKNLICTEEMLSSSTYYVSLYNRCVYCHDEVENNEVVTWNGTNYKPYKCACEKAEYELFLKREVLYKLKEIEKLNEIVDMDEIKKSIDKNEAAMAMEYNNL